MDVFTNDGKLIRRLVTRGALNSPWGLALAPDNFGRFSGALLVGNFGNGHINAYNPDTGAHLGQLRGTNGHPIAIEGLWSLRFGNGNAAKTNELIFSSGPDHETHGLLESSYWLAETAGVRSCSNPRKLASGRARERTGQTPTGADLSEHPAAVMRDSRGINHAHSNTWSRGAVRNQRLASEKRASPPICTLAAAAA